MSANNNDYDDNQNEDNPNYDDGNGDQDQEYDSQDGNSQNDGDDGDGNEGNNDDGGDNDDDDDDDDGDENADGHKYIRLRGLPWSATHKEILDFLKNINVVGGTDGIHIMTRRWDGVNSGEAYVVLKSQQDAVSAMKLDNASMGHRYIEVFNASPREATDAMRKTSSHGMSHVVKLRGLPFAANEQQVEELFNGLDIKPDREGIVFVKDRRGRATGEAFVQFESHEDTEQALGRNRQKIGHRYIEIFRSSIAELKRATGNNGRIVPYDLKDRGSNRFGNGNGNGNGIGNIKDFGGGNRNNRWGDNGGFGVGANNTLGFNNVPNFGNSGNFGNNGGGNFGNFGGGGGGGGGMGNFGNFGNNSGVGNFGNFGNNNGGNNFGNSAGGGNNGGGGGFNRFSGNSGNFGNDFGDFGNFGNDRDNNNMGGGKNNGGRGDDGFNNFGNFGNCGGNNMGGGFVNNMGGMGSMGGMGGGMGGGPNCEYYMIMMRGLPFTSFENDVFKFFEPLRPVNVRIHYNKLNGRHNGTAEALFEKFDDCQMAMKRHRCKMGARYIELFYNGRKPVKGGNNYSTGGNMGSGGGIGNSNNIGMGGGMPAGIFSRRI